VIGGKVFDLSKGGKSRYEIAYDGNAFRMREDKNLITQSQNRTFFPAAAPLPWEDLNVEQPETLERLIVEGTIKVATIEHVTWDGNDAVRVKFNYSDGDLKFLEIYYDPSKNYLPLSQKEYSREGEITNEVRNVEVASFDDQGNHYSIPLKGERLNYKAGQVTARRTFEVAADSVHFGVRIPNDRFVLTPGPDERIYDADIQRLIWDPTDSSASFSPDLGGVRVPPTGTPDPLAAPNSTVASVIAPHPSVPVPLQEMPKSGASALMQSAGAVIFLLVAAIFGGTLYMRRRKLSTNRTV
jgi:hypothetical protein